jgi:NADH-quinone oxidoreductase subunit M
MLYIRFDTQQPAGVMQFAENVPIVGAFHYHAAVDGIGVLFVLLTSLISLLSIVFILVRRLHESSILAVMMVSKIMKKVTNQTLLAVKMTSKTKKRAM